MFVEQLKEPGKILSEKRIIEQVPPKAAVKKKGKAKKSKKG